MTAIPALPAAAGWYTDGREPAYLRWFDGRTWTEQRKLRPGLSSLRRGALRRARVVERFSMR